MTAETDPQANREAVEIANQAIRWMARFPKLGAMEMHPDGFSQIDRPEFPYISVIEFGSDTEVKFGHIIMREGKRRYAKAGAMDIYHPDGSITWVICGYSCHTRDRGQRLAQHLQMDSLVHEAIHVIDGRRTPWRGDRFSESLMDDLQSYYCTPHEFNAHFHQGLFLMLQDLEMVKLKYSEMRKQNISSAYITERLLFEYWDGFFRGHLNQTFARKLRKPLWRVISAVGIGVVPHARIQ